ncbi:hypothetical protein SAMN04487907_101824 [Zunongwangia mangrovi]|uniref:Lipocalin-like domain-containing protein n=1 Tax=Zunongwangia mangrovi TaxID=1334022 RepID=A0A1I1E7A3_9FLAO|nr:hypothetical protein [Zunongwangia mangrovi]SFB83001.1 hypothetical protein SAMN04487907_101824 [Zunongwangia mangrovi]
MKRLFTLVFCVFSFILISCDKDEPVPEEFTIEHFLASDFPQEWVIVGIRTSMIPNAEIINVEDGTEYYIFNEDSTFQKRAEIEDELITAEGTFFIDERDFIILEYSQESALIASCSNQSKTEFLHFSDNQLINSNALSCDGLYYYYKKVK